MWLGKLTKCREAPSSGVIRRQGNGEKVQSRVKGGGLSLWNWKKWKKHSGKGKPEFGSKKNNPDQRSHMGGKICPKRVKPGAVTRKGNKAEGLCRYSQKKVEQTFCN